MLKTLHLTNAWHASSGGIATFYKQLLHAAERHRHSVRLIVPAETDAVEDISSFARIYHLAAPRAILNPAYRMILPHRYLWPGTAIRRILGSEQPDLIEICDKYSFPYLAGLIQKGWVGELKKQPVTVGLSCERMNENIGHYISQSPAAQWFARWYMRSIYFPQCDHHIAVSRHTAEELRSASHGHRIRRGVWIEPMGVDTEGLSPRLRDHALRAGLLDGAQVLLLYVGRLAPEKNLGLLAETLRELLGRGVDARLVIAGDGISRASLERDLPRHRARFLGHIGSRAELARLYASADIFVHPNPQEPFGIAPLEAMASGLPLVAPDRGGVTTYCTSANSWPSVPTPGAFADTIQDILHDPQLRSGKVEAALQTARQYAWGTVISRYFQLYEEIYATARQLPRHGIPPAFYSSLSKAS